MLGLSLLVLKNIERNCPHTVSDSLPHGRPACGVAIPSLNYAGLLNTMDFKESGRLPQSPYPPVMTTEGLVESFP